MEPNIAVLIDFENIAAGCEKEGLGRFKVDLIMNRMREKGRVLVARSYADWGRFARFKKDLMFEQVTLFELSAHGMNDKNRADVAMVVDCLELAFTRDYLDTFVVVSGDSDFTPLISKLRELNKRVIGIGTRRSTSRLIVEACDEFVFYDSLHSQRTQRSRSRSRTGDVEAPAEKLSREEAMELVTEALAALYRDAQSSIHASRIKEHILRKEKAFNEGDLGFSSLARFLEYCQTQGIVKLTKDNRAGGYRCAPPDAEGDESPEDPPAPARDLSDEAGRMYELLRAEEREPLSRDLRKALCEGILQNVADREERKRRVNIQWVTQDVTKTLKTHTPRPNARQVRDLVNTLHTAGAFLHSDGEPVRSFFAAFKLSDAKADDLLQKLDVALLRKLQELGVKLNEHVADLAELLLDDREKTRAMEELIAWELMAPQPEVAVPTDDDGPKKRRRSRRRKDDDEEATEAAEAPAEPKKAEAPKAAAKADAPEAEAEEKPKRKRAPRKTKAQREAAAEAKAAEEAAEEAEAAKPKAKSTRAVRKKAAPKKAAPKKAEAKAEAEEAPVKKAQLVGLDEEPAPAPKRKRAPRKKKTEEAAEA